MPDKRLECLARCRINLREVHADAADVLPVGRLHAHDIGLGMHHGVIVELERKIQGRPDGQFARRLEQCTCEADIDDGHRIQWALRAARAQ